VCEYHPTFLLSSLVLVGTIIIITSNTLDIFAGIGHGFSFVKKWTVLFLKNSEVAAQIGGESEIKIKEGGIFKTTWTGNPRIIKSGQTDPYESRFILHGGVETVRVNGDGTLSPVSSTSKDSYPNSPRLYVKGPWKNTEITIWAKASSFDYLQLRGRNDHNTKCGFGGYLVIFRSGGSTGIAKEITHPLYTKKIPGNHFPFAEDEWIGYRARFIDSSIEGFVNTDGIWKKVISATDTGQWSYENMEQVEEAKAKCGAINNEPFSRQQPYNFVRINNGVDVFFKSYTVREIKF
jgi:hypothetical protein